MANYLGDFIGTETVAVTFDSYDSSGASVTLTGLATSGLEIYKDGGATTRASDSGYTLIDTDGIDIGSITGHHGFTIDLSDNSDAGFFSPGSDFRVVVTGLTIDSQSVNACVATFSIQNRSGELFKTVFHERGVAGNFTIEMVQSADHVSPATGLTVTAELSKDTADSFSSAAASVTEIGDGVYRVAYTSADANADEFVAWRFSATGADSAKYEMRLYDPTNS